MEPAHLISFPVFPQGSRETLPGLVEGGWTQDTLKCSQHLHSTRWVQLLLLLLRHLHPRHVAVVQQLGYTGPGPGVPHQSGLDHRDEDKVAVGESGELDGVVHIGDGLNFIKGCLISPNSILP